MKKDLKILKNDKNKVKNSKWIITVTILAFVISFIFSFISEKLMPNVNITIGIIIVIVFVFIGIVFDVIGVAVTTGEESPFHSMASQKIKGALLAIKLKKNASKVSSFCNDVIGDICGIISGSAGVAIAIKISTSTNYNALLVNLIVTSLIAGMTIGGKACGKSFAINNSNMILYRICSILSFFKKK